MSTPIARTPNPALASIPDRMRFELLRWLIVRRISCPLTGQVLDLETAVAILDPDGDPHLPLSPAGWDSLPVGARVEIATVDGSKVDDPRHRMDAHENGLIGCSCGARISDGVWGQHVAGVS